MKKILLFFISLTFLMPVSIIAQHDANAPQRKKWYKEMQQFKRDFIARELQLTDDQKTRFFAEYDKMESELEAVRLQTRKMVKAVKEKGENTTELEYEKAAEASFEVKEKEAAIEKKYFNEFKKILKPKQLFQLKDAELRFNRELIKHKSKSDPKHSHKQKKS